MAHDRDKLDLTGLKCPLPALKTRKALKALQPGDLLEVHCTDPLSDRHSQPDPGNRRQGRDHRTRGTAHRISD
jgi:TusA-related sulfurtransferase